MLHLKYAHSKANDALFERLRHFRERGRAVGAPRDQLGDHRVVENRHL